MDYDRILSELTTASDSKILYLILDGLGGLPDPRTGRSELEAANIPNLDSLAEGSTCGIHDPVLPGITPGSGPGHLGIFGFDPLAIRVGRGVLEAFGIGFELLPGDVAARGNFCTLDEGRRVVDRRAGRIATEENERLCRQLSEIHLEGVDLFVRTVKEHRFLLVLRGEGLDGGLEDMDPQKTGVPPGKAEPREAGAKRTAELVDRFVRKAEEILAGEHPANGILLRGFDIPPVLPSFQERYGVRAAAIAAYPMYRGLARLVGMHVLETADALDAQVRTLEEAYPKFDFFFVHYKPPDSRGEDGDFEAKVRALEALDRQLPPMTALGFDTIVVTGDHSTPSILRSHSWHPVPFLIHSKWCVAGGTSAFTEKACRAGMEGRIPARCLIPLALAHALRLEKYGA